MCGRRGACRATTRSRCWRSSRRTSASSLSASTTRTSPTMRGASSTATAIRSPRPASIAARPRRDRLGRLWRAGDLRGRPRRPHRLQAGRADHRGQFQTRAEAGDREGAGGASVLLRRALYFISSGYCSAPNTKRERQHAEHLEVDPEVGGLRAPHDFVEHRRARRRTRPSATSACASLRRSG